MIQYTNITTLGNYMLTRGIENGKRFTRREAFKPTLFVKQTKKSPTKWKTLEGYPLDALKFNSIYDCREFLNKYREVKNFKIYGNTFHQYAYISEFFGGNLKFETLDVVTATIDIEVGSENGFPEPKHAFEPITAITLHIFNRFNKEADSDVYYVFGCGEFDTTSFDIRSDIQVRYIHCADEKDLIFNFLDIWESNYPDIVTGWNIQKFDFPYIINRMNRLFMEDDVKRLSPWNKIVEKEVFDKVGTDKVQIYDIYGVAILDYIDLYKKFSPTPNQESYKLNHIAFMELGEKKLDYSDYDGLFDLYKRDYQKFIEYNIQDVGLVLRLNEKLKLLELGMTLAYENKVNFADVFSQVRMWDSITYNHLRNKGIIVPPKTETVKSEQYAGAYVKEPNPGRYEYVVSVDLDGLYPHLFMMYNLGPETLVDPSKVSPEFYDWFKNQRVSIEALLNQEIDTSLLKKYNLTLTPNGQVFKRDHQGFLPELMESMYADRKRYKDEMIKCKKKLEKGYSLELQNQITMFNNFQSAKKVTLNSAYGAIGNQYFRFFDVRIAEAVTTSGQLAIRWIQKEMNEYLNKLCKTTNYDFVIASDTDSMYLNLGPLIEKAMPEYKEVEKIKVIRAIEKLCDSQIQNFIKDSYRRLDDYVNSYASKMNMKREAIADAAIWTGKKHYLMNVWNNEGVEYNQPKLKVVGLEAVKAGSLSTQARNKIKKAYELIIDGDINKLREFVENYREDFKKLSVEEIALPRGCNNLAKYSDEHKIWGFKTPFHVKGALVYNHLLKIKKLDKRFPSIKEGEKIKYVYLKEPNPVACDVISFLTSLPKELDLHPFIDYDTQFEKTFVSPVETILDAIGWELEQSSSLESLFE